VRQSEDRTHRRAPHHYRFRGVGRHGRAAPGEIVETE